MQPVSLVSLPRLRDRPDQWGVQVGANALGIATRRERGDMEVTLKRAVPDRVVSVENMLSTAEDFIFGFSNLRRLPGHRDGYALRVSLYFGRLTYMYDLDSPGDFERRAGRLLDSELAQNAFDSYEIVEAFPNGGEVGVIGGPWQVGLRIRDAIDDRRCRWDADYAAKLIAHSEARDQVDDIDVGQAADLFRRVGLSGRPDLGLGLV